MDLKEYRKKLVGNEEERAVSPVIGVVLMVAITVILAAVIAAFVMDMGDDMGQSAPSTNFDVESEEDSYVEIHHEGGDSFLVEDITVQTDSGEIYEGSDDEVNDDGSNVEFDEEMSTGDTLRLNDGPEEGDDELVIIHDPSDSIIYETDL